MDNILIFGTRPARAWHRQRRPAPGSGGPAGRGPARWPRTAATGAGRPQGPRRGRASSRAGNRLTSRTSTTSGRGGGWTGRGVPNPPHGWPSGHPGTGEGSFGGLLLRPKHLLLGQTQRPKRVCPAKCSGRKGPGGPTREAVWELPALHSNTISIIPKARSNFSDQKKRGFGKLGKVMGSSLGLLKPQGFQISWHIHLQPVYCASFSDLKLGVTDTFKLILLG